MARGIEIGVAVAALTALTPGGALGQIGPNRPPGAPLHVTPTEGHRFKHGEPQRLTVIAFDPDLDPYTASVTVRDPTTQAVVFERDTHPAPSGVQTSIAILPPLPPGSYTWSAHARDVRGASGSESASRSFDVGPPAAAGAGGFVGTVDYKAPGLPRVACAATRFELEAQSGAAFFDVVVSGFAGAVTFTGFGQSSCDAAALGFGTVTLSAQGTGPTGSTLSCPVVDGSYTRVGAEMVATLTGDCVVNGFTTGPLTWTYTAQVAPLSTGAGTTDPITRTTFNGAFAVRSLLLTGSGPGI